MYEHAPLPVPEGVDEDPAVYGLLEWQGAPALREMIVASIDAAKADAETAEIHPEQMKFFAQPPGHAEYQCLWCCRTAQVSVLYD